MASRIHGSTRWRWVWMVAVAIPAVMLATACSVPASSPAPGDVQVPRRCWAETGSSGLAAAVTNASAPNGVGPFLS